MHKNVPTQVPKVRNFHLVEVSLLVNCHIVSSPPAEAPEISEDYGGPADDSPSFVEVNTTSPPEDASSFGESASRAKKDKKKKKKTLDSF